MGKTGRRGAREFGRMLWMRLTDSKKQMRLCRLATASCVPVVLSRNVADVVCEFLSLFVATLSYPRFREQL